MERQFGWWFFEERRRHYNEIIIVGQNGYMVRRWEPVYRLFSGRNGRKGNTLDGFRIKVCNSIRLNC